MANIVPDSRMPRRLASVINATEAKASSTLICESSGIADVIAATPAAVDTATVMM